MVNEDKGKTKMYDQSDLMGMKPFGNIGPDRTVEQMKVVGKLKKKKAGQLRAKGSTEESGETDNAGGTDSSNGKNAAKISTVIGHFVNGR